MFYFLNLKREFFGSFRLPNVLIFAKENDFFLQSIQIDSEAIKNTLLLFKKGHKIERGTISSIYFESEFCAIYIQ